MLSYGIAKLSVMFSVDHFRHNTYIHMFIPGTLSTSVVEQISYANHQSVFAFYSSVRAPICVRPMVRKRII